MMHRSVFLIFLFFVLVAFAVLHVVGIEFRLYWQFVWLDLLVHFLAGCWAGGIALWINFLSGYVSRPVFKRHPLVLALVVAGLVGFIWEAFELFIGATFISREQYAADTITDFVADGLGALSIGWFFVLKELPRIGTLK